MKKSISEIRKFYDTHYHFDEDIEKPDIGRLVNFFKKFTTKAHRKILDVGCGSGLNLKFFSSKELELYGIDISFRALRLSREVVPDAAVTVADGQTLPFKDNAFDYITLLGVLEHFPEPREGLSEINRVLKKDGSVCFVVPNSFGKIGKILKYSGTEQEQELLLTLEEWKKLIEDSGFVVYHIHRDRGPRVLKNFKIIRLIFRLLLKITLVLPIKFAYQFVIYARKK
ncbi:hypothetical protein DRQ26_02255 [bacterium]|nr:MAG: hypothetical protein DRQ26_02255 [bacterium]